MLLGNLDEKQINSVLVLLKALQQPVVSGSLPTEKQVVEWSDKYMKLYSASPKLYHKMGAVDLLKKLKDGDWQ